MTTVHEVLRRVPKPRALRAAVADPRRAGRALSCKTRASTRWHRVRHKLARVHALARVYALARVHARLAASSLTRSTKATTGLARTHGQIVMGTGAHMRGMRTTRKSWTDASAGESRLPAHLHVRVVWQGTVMLVANSRRGAWAWQARLEHPAGYPEGAASMILGR